MADQVGSYQDSGFDEFLRRVFKGSQYFTNERTESQFEDGSIIGSKLQVGTVTLSTLNFVPLESFSSDPDAIIATINASGEGITIDADNITISGATTFNSGYDPTTKVASTAGTYTSAASGARVQIFPSANVGIQVYDEADNTVFQVAVGGVAVGDVRIGDVTGGTNYVHWDKSQSALRIGGELSVYDNVSRLRIKLYQSSGQGLLEFYNASLAAIAHVSAATPTAGADEMVVRMLTSGANRAFVIFDNQENEDWMRLKQNSMEFTIRGTDAGRYFAVVDGTTSISWLNFTPTFSTYNTAGTHLFKTDGSDRFEVTDVGMTLTGNITMSSAAERYIKHGTTNRIGFRTASMELYDVSALFFEERTSDEGSEGSMWWRSDLGELRFRVGGTTHSIDMTAV